jgi:hypothetical protein
MKKPAMLVWLVALAAIGGAGWAALQTASPAREDTSLARLMPANAMLFIEAKDFSSLLNEWNGSPQKSKWLGSDNYSVFSRSRLFLKLARAQEDFARAAGVPPDMKFTREIAGERSAIALYDIGELHLLYISRLPNSSAAAKSGIWQQRAKFETRMAGNQQFFVRKDEESNRVAAFAIAGEYFVLATREDLIAGALALIAGRDQRTIETETWFTEPLKAAGAAGDLRMVLDLQRISADPRFRTYWVQQNITEMQGYRAAVSDLHRKGTVYREERVILPARDQPPTTATAAQEVAALASAVPTSAGFYSAIAEPKPADIVATLQAKLLTHSRNPVVVERMAPMVSLRDGAAGSESDLEIRIDEAPPSQPAGSSALDPLMTVIQKARVSAMLAVHSSQKSGVFVGTRAAVVLSGGQEWDAAGVRSALQAAIAPGLSVSQLGIGWKQVKSDGSEYLMLDGLTPLVLMMRGKQLLIANNAEDLVAISSSLRKSAAQEQSPAAYIAGLNHATEREAFAKMMKLIDEPNRQGSRLSAREPEFFSDNVASLSQSLAGVRSESVRLRRENNRILQTVTYEWLQ